MIKRIYLIINLLLLLCLLLSFYLFYKDFLKKNHQKNNPQNTYPIKHVFYILQEDRSFDSYFGTYPGADGINLNIAYPAKKEEPATVIPVHFKDYTSQSAPMAYVDFYDKGREDMDGMLKMIYYDWSDIPNYWSYADNFVLAYRFFCATTLGWSVPTHFYAIAATSEGFLLNTAHDERLESKTLVDLLEEKNISWKYYMGTLDSVLSQDPNKWNPFLCFKQYRKIFDNVVGLREFYKDAKQDNFPAVSWIIAEVEASEHPPANIRVGMNHVTNIINAIMESPSWKESAIFIAWDDNGNFFDHYRFEPTDEFGPGPRVPALIISPYAKKGYIDHTAYDATSPLKFIETIFGLESLNSRDGKSADMMNAFDFKQPPRDPVFLEVVKP